jgi:hypothetical protein
LPSCTTSSRRAWSSRVPFWLFDGHSGNAYLSRRYHAAKPVAPNIAGVYKVVGSGACQTNQAGFSAYPDLFALEPTFHGFQWQYLLPGVVGHPAGDFHTTCLYVATTHPDGTLTLNDSCNGNTLSGIGKGEATNLSPATWHVIPAQGLILLSTTSPRVTTLVNTKNNVNTTFKRICQAHAVGVKF